MTENNSPGPALDEGAFKKPAEPVRHRSLWLWFAAGFLIVFVGMLLGITMYPWSPRGDALMICKLWEYYVIEIQRASLAPQNLGPTTGSTEAAIKVAIEHLLISIVAGIIALGIGWVVRKIKGR